MVGSIIKLLRAKNVELVTKDRKTLNLLRQDDVQNFLRKKN